MKKLILSLAVVLTASWSFWAVSPAQAAPGMDPAEAARAQDKNADYGNVPQPLASSEFELAQTPELINLREKKCLMDWLACRENAQGPSEKTLCRLEYLACLP